jgi:hypothetical protein
MQKITFGFAMSASGFDIAPRPILAARPATVGECQCREQLSIELVPKPERMNFCTT